MFKKLKLSSILDSITTKRMYGNQIPYMQSVIFQKKTITSTHMVVEQIRHIDIDKDKHKERLKQREKFCTLTLEALRPKDVNQQFNYYCCVHHFVYLFLSSQVMLILFNYHLIINCHITS